MYSSGLECVFASATSFAYLSVNAARNASEQLVYVTALTSISLPAFSNATLLLSLAASIYFCRSIVLSTLVLRVLPDMLFFMDSSCASLLMVTVSLLPDCTFLLFFVPFCQT